MTGYQQRENTGLQRLIEQGFVVRGNRCVSLKWAYDYQQKLLVMQRDMPLIEAAPSALPAHLIIHARSHRITLINSNAFEVTSKELKMAFGDQITIIPATMLIEDFLLHHRSDDRIAIVGNRDVYLGRTMAAMHGEWYKANKPDRVTKTLLTMTKTRAHAGQMIQLYEFRTQQRIDQLKELLGDVGKRVLFVFAYPPSPYERSRFFSGSVYRSNNYMARIDCVPFLKYQIIHRGPKKTTSNGEMIFIQGMESVFTPLNACFVSLLPHLKPNDFDNVVLFTDGATRSVWKAEAIRVAAHGNLFIF